MALGKYTRVDGRKSSTNYCSSVTVACFVALCLVGVWMFTSSEVGPVQTVDLPSEKQQSQVKQQGTDVFSGSNTKQFEDNPGDLPEDATKADSNVRQKTDENNVDTNGGADQKANEEEPAVEEKQQDKQTEDNSSSEETNKSQIQNQERTEDASEETNKDGGGTSPGGIEKNSEDGGQNITESDESQNKTDQNLGDNKEEQREGGEIAESVDQNQNKESIKSSVEEGNYKPKAEVFPSAAQSELLNETTTQNGAFSTQADESKNEKESQVSSESKTTVGLHWKLCDSTAGPDFIPCLDNLDAIRHLRTTKHYEHRERHCPAEPPTCLVPLPQGYKFPVEWPRSREKVWYNNVPHTKLVEIKGHQNWVKVSGEYLTFPGGGTQFKHGALHYIEFIENILRKQNVDFSWGKSPRVVLDVGCGVASFGGFLFDKDVLTMSFAPKDEHEAQVQFALERGIPAVLAVMGTTRLPFPGMVFDVVHCARCRVPWHIEGGKLLLELNRVLRPGGFFVWSATPVYQKLQEDVEIWHAMSTLTKSMCWELVAKEKDRVNGVGVAVYRKPTSNRCYEQRSKNEPPMCSESDDLSAAWNVSLQACMHRVPQSDSQRGSHWPMDWPARIGNPPYWLTSSQVGVYGKSAPEDFTNDYEHWKRIVSQSYLKGLGIDWSNVRNVMDMRSVYGGFAAALRDLKVWVLNVVTIDSPDTLPIIYERGLFGIYHDWCESFSTYPRSYDLLHADHLLSLIKNKCSLRGLVSEVDRILRPDGKLIVRDNVEIINEVENMLRSMKWEIRMTYSREKEGLLCAQKTMWRPEEMERLQYARAT